MKFLLTVFILALSFSTDSLADDFEANITYGNSITPARAKLIKKNFADALKKFDVETGAICLVEKGKIFLQEPVFGDGVKGKSSNLPLGKTSSALVSLMVLEMQMRGVLDASAPVSSQCSMFGIRGGEKISLENLLAMNAGIDAHSDSLVPADSSASELFGIASQLPLSFPAGDSRNSAYSEMSAACAAYIAGYVYNPKEKNLKKSFARASNDFLFLPLSITEQKYRNFDSPFFGAKPYSLKIEDIAKWLSCETSKTPPIGDAEKIANRRVSEYFKNSDGGVQSRFAGVWLNSFEKKVALQLSADSFQGWSHIVGIAPREGVAFAVFVRSKSGRICAAMVSNIADMIANPVN